MLPSLVGDRLCLQIAEVSRTGVRSTIIVPESGWMTFRDMLNSFITGEATEGIDVPDLPEARKDTADTAAGPASSGLQLWVENLPWEVKDEEIRTYFQSVGPVDTCAIQRRPDGKSRGTAIVRFTNAKDASTAIESIDGTEISGRPMRVRLDRRG